MKGFRHTLATLLSGKHSPETEKNQSVQPRSLETDKIQTCPSPPQIPQAVRIPSPPAPATPPTSNFTKQPSGTLMFHYYDQQKKAKGIIDEPKTLQHHLRHRPQPVKRYRLVEEPVFSSDVPSQNTSWLYSKEVK